MERQELLTKSEVFEDEILAGTQRTDSPSKEVPEQHDHGKNLTEICIVRLTAKSLILRVRNVLTRHSRSRTAHGDDLVRSILCGTRCHKRPHPFSRKPEAEVGFREMFHHL